MKRFFCLGIFPLLLALSGSAAVPVHSNIAYEGAGSTNGIRLTWEAIPTKLYNVMTTTALGQQPWQALNPAPLYASNNWVQFRDTNLQSARFYKVVKLDTDAPEIWRLAPGSNAIAVGLQSPLKMYLRDETGIDPTSVVFTVGRNAMMTLSDSRLSFTNDVLTYTPGTNEFLGTNAQTISAFLIVRDTLGHGRSASWSFQLEQSPILSTNAVLIGGAGGLAAKSALAGASSGLTLTSTNGDTYVFSYTGASSGLSTGQVLVSIDANLPYKRKILTLTDDPGNQTVSLLTTQACLAECIQQGSFRLTGDFSQPTGGAGIKGKAAAGSSGGTRIPLDGIVIYGNETIRIEVVSGQITFNPDVTYAADFNWGLSTFDLDISGTVDCDLTLRGSLTGSGEFNPEPIALLPDPIPVPIAVGAIGVVPIVLTAKLEINLGLEAQAEAEGSLTAGFTFTRTLNFGSKLRNGAWDNYANQSGNAAWSPPTWQINGSGFVQVYLEPKITLLVDYLAGGSADLKPYVELDATACVDPGQARVDLRGYVGLSSTLALDLGILDRFFTSLPSWQPFIPIKEPIPYAHTIFTTTIGSPPQTFGNMVWIPCGTFTMGSPESEPARDSVEGPQTTVTLSHGFWMGKYEVRQGEYLAVMGNNPSWFNGPRPYSYGQDGGGPVDYGTSLNRPVEQVTWNDAVAYCAAVTQRERSAGRLPVGYVYRLPTEAEWEYACRAGTTTPFHYGNELRSGIANFNGYYEYPPCGSDTYYCYNPSGICLGRTTSVESYAPNAWGLYNMHGNVWEWCQDGWSSSLPGGSVTDPQGPAPGSSRVFRGGSWSTYAWHCRSAYRDAYGSATGLYVIGFRVVLAPGQP